MALDDKRIITFAVEDELLLITEGHIRKISADKVEEVGFSPTKEVHRDKIKSTNSKSEFIKNDIDEIVDFICKFISTRDPVNNPFYAIGLSIFGNVDTFHGNVYHIPNRVENAPNKTNFEIKKSILKKIPSIKESKIFVLNDATAATYGEFAAGIGQNTPGAFTYVSLGRGINGGLVIDGKLHVGILNPEMAHFNPRIHDNDKKFHENLLADENPKCLSHRDCLLGLTSLRAVKSRVDAGMSLKLITDIYAYYIAQLCLTMTLIVSPSKIAIGTSIFNYGILREAETIRAIRKHYADLKGIYPYHPDLADTKKLIVGASLGDQASSLGLIEFLKFDLLK